MKRPSLATPLSTLMPDSVLQFSGACSLLTAEPFGPRNRGQSSAKPAWATARRSRHRPKVSSRKLIVTFISGSLSEKVSDPLEASRFFWFYQPRRRGSDPYSKRLSCISRDTTQLYTLGFADNPCSLRYWANCIGEKGNSKIPQVHALQWSCMPQAYFRNESCRPCDSTTALQILSPKPVPGTSLKPVRVRSARKNRLKTFGKSSSSIPMLYHERLSRNDQKRLDFFAAMVAKLSIHDHLSVYFTRCQSNCLEPESIDRDSPAAQLVCFAQSPVRSPWTPQPLEKFPLTSRQFRSIGTYAERLKSWASKIQTTVAVDSQSC